MLNCLILRRKATKKGKIICAKLNQQKPLRKDHCDYSNIYCLVLIGSSTQSCSPFQSENCKDSTNAITPFGACRLFICLIIFFYYHFSIYPCLFPRSCLIFLFLRRTSFLFCSCICCFRFYIPQMNKII